jgi:hypothetical protein
MDQGEWNSEMHNQWMYVDGRLLVNVMKLDPGIMYFNVSPHGEPS